MKVCLVLVWLGGCGGIVAGSTGAPAGGDARVTDAAVSPGSALDATSIPGTTPLANDPDAAMLCVALDGGEQPIVNKSFLVNEPPPGSSATGDRWNAQVRIVAATPDPGNLLVGTTWTGQVTFRINNSTVQLLSLKPGPLGQSPRTVIDAWPIADVDVSPGCATNQNDPAWQTRGWVTWNFAKTDASDLAIFDADGESFLPACLKNASPAEASLIPGSFAANPVSGKLQWTESITATSDCSADGGGSIPTALEVTYDLTQG